MHAWQMEPLPQLPGPLLATVLAKAGAWSPPSMSLQPNLPSCCAWQVCREWRDALLDSDLHVACLLVEVHGPRKALVR